jgi:hypothetical protein
MTSAPRLTFAGASPSPAGPVVNPFRPRDAAQYDREKAAADATYARWRGTHASVAGGPGFQAPSVGIVALKKPGFSAAKEGGGGTPPDATGAVGPANYLEWVNSTVHVYQRTLASPPVASLSEDSFTGSHATCDGQIKWDQAAGRWLYWALDCGAASGSQGWSVGWSRTASPLPLTTGWCKYHAGTGHNLDDYGKLGQDDQWIEIGVNQYQDNSNATPAPIVWTLSKPAVGSTTCPAPSALQLFGFAPNPSTAFTPQPANIFGSSRTGYIVANDTFSSLRMFHLTGAPPAAPTLIDDGDVSVPTYAVPPSLPQPGSTDPVDTSDTRLTQANAALDPQLGTGVFGIWTQHTVAGAGGVGSVVRWYEIEDGLSTPAQTGTISAPGSGSFAFDAAIAPNSTGNGAAINYNTATPLTHIQVRARIHAIGSAAGSTSNDTVLVTSTGIVDDFSCPSLTHKNRPCRWGDYAGASVDPNGGNAVWGTAELAGAPDTSAFSARWQTENFDLVV